MTISNLVFMFRTSRPELIDFSQWKDHIKHILGRLTNTPEEINDNVLLQANLSIKTGGIGLRCNEHYPKAAYVASICASKQNIRMILQDEHWEHPDLEWYIEELREESLPEMFPAYPEFVQGVKVQRKLCKALDAKTASQLIDEAEGLRERARLRGLNKNQHCGDWLTARPDPNLHMKFDDRHFAAALRYRLGLPMYRDGQICYSCGSVLDVQGDHAMHCKKEGYLTTRHNGIQSLLLHLAAASGLNPTKEDNRLIPNKHGKRPGDIILKNETGLITAYDVTVRSPLQVTYRKAAARDARHTLNAADRDKYTRYNADEDGLIAHNVKLVPLSFTTQGAVSDNVDEFVRKLSGELHFKWGYSAKSTTRFIFQQISALLHQHNAQAFLLRNAIPTHPNVEKLVDALGFVS